MVSRPTARGSSRARSRPAVVVRPTGAGDDAPADPKPSSYDTYRGTLKVSVSAPSSASVINTVGLDTYLRGVVPVEMPVGWPVQALRAQAVAARSYAPRLHPGPGALDVYDDTRSQVYRGAEAETARRTSSSPAPRARSCVRARLVNAFFHSTGGGATENNEYAFVGLGRRTASPVAYLRGLADRRPPTGRPYDAASPYYRWSTAR